MERDFLGVIGREEEEEGSKNESAYLAGGPAMPWPFPSKAGSAPSLMSFRSAVMEESKERVFDQLPASGFRPAAPPQRPFGVESQESPQYAMLGHRGAARHVLSGARMVPALVHHPVPYHASNPMFKINSSPNLPNAGGGLLKQQPFAVNNTVAGSTVGVYVPRDLRKPKSAQLTMFFGGCVNVFDNVSVEKAQEIMLLARRGSVPSIVDAGRKPNSPVFAPAEVTVPEVLHAKQTLLQKREHVVPAVSGISSLISVVSQAVSLPRSASSSNVDSVGPKSAAPLVVHPTSQPSSSPTVMPTTTTAAAITPRAVPQARNASLARFLEKRKERVASVVPYPSSKSPAESSDMLRSTNVHSKSSCTDNALSSNHDELLSLGQPRNISFREESPSTRLQI